MKNQPATILGLKTTLLVNTTEIYDQTFVFQGLGCAPP